MPTDPGPAVHTEYYGLEKQHHEIDGRGKDVVQVQELGGRERPVELPQQLCYLIGLSLYGQYLLKDCI